MITLNNTKEDISTEGLTISKLLALKNYTFKMLVIKINGTLIPKNQYESTFINDGDDVMVLHLISGG
jgi:sulfur carrier protein